MSLKIGQTIRMRQGGDVVVDALLGEGAQGWVYKVICKDGSEKALKWYKPSALKKIKKPGKFYDNIAALCDRQAPDDSFLWPKAITLPTKSGPFGYLMDIRESEYVGLVSIINLRNRFPSLYELCAAALNLCNAFSALHRDGYSYQDLNAGGVFIDVKTGNVKICDCDNVAPDGTNITGVQGFPGFMAPEIVRGDAKPSTVTDIYSLAVVLFYLTMLGHPLEGKNETTLSVATPANITKLYGSHPMFIFDEKGTNKPIRGVHDNPIRFWSSYPAYLKDAFSRAFSQDSLVGDKAHARKARPIESEWAKLFSRLREDIFDCPRCGEEVLFDPSLDKQKCPHCKKDWHPEAILELSTGAQIPLMEGKKIYESDVIESGDCKTVFARVVASSDSSVLSLLNCSGKTWTVISSSGKASNIEDGNKCAIAKEGKWLKKATFRFGTTEAKIK